MKAATMSRESAIATGALIDAQTGRLRSVTRDYFGNTPVAMTAALFALIQNAAADSMWDDAERGEWRSVCRPQLIHGMWEDNGFTVRLINAALTGISNRIAIRVIESNITGTVTFTLASEG